MPIPDILFLDINMPKMNGGEALVEIRSDSKFDNMPIIIYSTSTIGDVILMMFERGADAFITKPNNFNAWKNVIYKAIITPWHLSNSKRNITSFMIS